MTLWSTSPKTNSWRSHQRISASANESCLKTNAAVTRSKAGKWKSKNESPHMNEGIFFVLRWASVYIIQYNSNPGDKLGSATFPHGQVLIQSFRKRVLPSSLEFRSNQPNRR